MILLSAILIVVCIVAAGFYAGVEMGFYRLNRVRLALAIRKRSRRAAWLDACVRRPDRFVVMTLVGHNLFVFFATFLCTRLYEPAWGERAEFLSTLTLIVPIFVFAEVLPKEVIGRAADTVMYRVSAALALSDRVLAPAVWLLVRVQRLWRIFPRYRTAPAEIDVERHRLEYFVGVGAQEGALTAYQHAMAANIMRLRATAVDRIMVPRASVVSLDSGRSLDDCRALARQNHFRRYPVADASGRLVGFVNILDVLGHEQGVFDLADHVRRPVVLRPDDSVIDALHRLKRGGQPMGFVEDSGGHVVGIVTLKDLIEEITGELGAW